MVDISRMQCIRLSLHQIVLACINCFLSCHWSFAIYGCGGQVQDLNTDPNSAIWTPDLNQNGHLVRRYVINFYTIASFLIGKIPPLCSVIVDKLQWGGQFWAAQLKWMLLWEFYKRGILVSCTCIVVRFHNSADFLFILCI